MKLTWNEVIRFKDKTSWLQLVYSNTWILKKRRKRKKGKSNQFNNTITNVQRAIIFAYHDIWILMPIICVSRWGRVRPHHLHLSLSFSFSPSRFVQRTIKSRIIQRRHLSIDIHTYIHTYILSIYFLSIEYIIINNSNSNKNTRFKY